MSRDPAAARALSPPPQCDQRSRPALGLRQRCLGRGQSHALVGLLPERRQARARARARSSASRSTRWRRGHRPGHAAAFAGTRHRRPGLRAAARSSRARIATPGLAHAHDAAADREQSAGRVRAAVRRRRHRGPAHARRAQARSLLDTLRAEIAALQKTLPASDRERLGAYVEDVREIERRIANAQRRPGVTAMRPSACPRISTSHVKLQLDLLALAWRADITRIAHACLSRRKPATPPIRPAA